MKIQKLATLFLSLVLIFSLSLVACQKDPTTDKTASLDLAQSTLSLEVGENSDIAVTVKNSDEAFTATSSDVKIATVAKADSKITITAVKAGTATITVALGDIEKTVAVTVTQTQVQVEDDEIELEYDVISIAPGGTAELYADVVGDSTITVVDETNTITATSTVDNDEATITFTASESATLASTVTVTVTMGTAEAELEIDIASAGIVYGDGQIGGAPAISDEYGLIATGISEEFVSGTDLVFPRYGYFDDLWAPVSHIGTQVNETYPIAFTIPQGKVITGVNTGESATTIQDDSFKNINTISSVYIGRAISGLGNGIFDNWESCSYDTQPNKTYQGTVETLTFSPNCKITVIGSSAFLGNNIAEVILPDTISIIGTNAFKDTAIKTLKLPSAWVESNGAYGDGQRYGQQFFNCTELENLYLPWQIFFSVASDHYPVNTDPADVKLAEDLGLNLRPSDSLLRTIFMDNLSFYNAFGKADSCETLNIYYSGEKALYDNIFAINKISPFTDILVNSYVYESIFEGANVYYEVAYGDDIPTLALTETEKTIDVGEEVEIDITAENLKDFAITVADPAKLTAVLNETKDKLVLTGLAEGSTTVTVSGNGREQVLTVLVIDSANVSLVLLDDKISVGAGASVTLEGTCSTDTVDMTFASSVEGITVTEVLTGTSAVLTVSALETVELGQVATITITYGEKTYTFTVEVASNGVTVNENGVVTGLTADFTGGELYIPSYTKANGRWIQVVELGNGTDAITPAEGVKITELYTGEFVTKVSNSAFYLIEVPSIIFGEEVTYIGNDAFYNYNDGRASETSVSSIVFEGNKLTEIGDYAFNTNNLSIIDLPDSLTTLGAQSFVRSTATTIIMPKNVVSGGFLAFMDCIDVENIYIPWEAMYYFTSTEDASANGITLADNAPLTRQLLNKEWLFVNNGPMNHSNKFNVFYSGTKEMYESALANGMMNDKMIVSHFSAEKAVTYFDMSYGDATPELSVTDFEDKIIDIGEAVVFGYVASNLKYVPVVTSSNNAVATVAIDEETKQITVTAVAVGDTQITVYAMGISYTVLFQILDPNAPTMILNYTDVSVGVNGQSTITATANVGVETTLTSTNANVSATLAFADGVVTITITATAEAVLGEFAVITFAYGDKDFTINAEVASNGVVYAKENDYAVVTGVTTGFAGALFVPQYGKVGEEWLQVKYIGNGNTLTVGEGVSITSVDTGSALEIRDNAFLDMYQIASLYVNSSLTKIGNAAFKKNFVINDVSIFGQGLTEFGAHKFTFEGTLKSVKFAENSALTHIGSEAFYLNELNSFMTPNTVSYIGENAFFITGMTEFNIPDAWLTLGHTGKVMHNNYMLNTIHMSSVFANNSTTFRGNVEVLFCDAMDNVDPHVREPNQAPAATPPSNIVIYFDGTRAEYNAFLVSGLNGHMNNCFFNDQFWVKHYLEVICNDTPEHTFTVTDFADVSLKVGETTSFDFAVTGNSYTCEDKSKGPQSYAVIGANNNKASSNLTITQQAPYTSGKISVKGLAEGTSKIVVRNMGIYHEITVTVLKPAFEVADFENGSILVGEEKSYTYSLANIDDSMNVTAKTSDASRATVAVDKENKLIKVTGVAVGFVTVTVSIANISHSIDLTVTSEDAELSFDNTEMSVAVGGTATLVAFATSNDEVVGLSFSDATALEGTATVANNVATITVTATGALLKSNHTMTVTFGEKTYTIAIDVASAGVVYAKNGESAMVTGVTADFTGELFVAKMANVDGQWLVVNQIGNGGALTVADGVSITSVDTGSAKYIADNAFYGMASLTTVYINTNLLSIGASAFELAAENVTTLDNIDAGYKFTYAGGIETLTFAEDSKLTTIGGSAFKFNKVGVFDMPDSVTTIADWAFWNTGLTEIHFSRNLTNVNNMSFDCYNITKIYIPIEYASRTSVFNGLLLCNNDMSCKVPYTVYFEGTRAEFDAMVSAITGAHMKDLVLNVNNGKMTVVCEGDVA